MGFLAVLLFMVAQTAFAQCGKFTDTPKESEALEAHVLYRDAIKMKDYDGAFENWKIAYELAPAADGKRASHFSDGIIIYKNEVENEADAAKRKEYYSHSVNEKPLIIGHVHTLNSMNFGY